MMDDSDHQGKISLEEKPVLAGIARLSCVITCLHFPVRPHDGALFRKA